MQSVRFDAIPLSAWCPDVWVHRKSLRMHFDHCFVCRRSLSATHRRCYLEAVSFGLKNNPIECSACSNDHSNAPYWWNADDRRVSMKSSTWYRKYLVFWSDWWVCSNKTCERHGNIYRPCTSPSPICWWATFDHHSIQPPKSEGTLPVKRTGKLALAQWVATGGRENMRYTLKIPAIESVKLDVYDSSKNSLISMANAMNAPAVAWTTKYILSGESPESDSVSKNSKSEYPANAFKEILNCANRR